MTNDPRIRNIQRYSDYLDQANDVLHQLIVASSSQRFFNLRVPNPIVFFQHEPVVRVGCALLPADLCQAVKKRIWFMLSSEDDWQLLFEVLFSFLDLKSKHEVIIKIFMKELTPDTKQQLQELLRSQVLRNEYRDAPDEALFWVFKSHLTAYMLLHCYGLVTPSSLICFLRSYGRCFRSVRIPNWLCKSIPFVLPELSWLIFNQRIDTAPNTIKKLLQQTLNDDKFAAQTFEQVLDSQRPDGSRLRDFLKALGITAAVNFFRQHFRHIEINHHFDFVLAAQVLTLLPRHYWPKTANDIDVFLQDVCFCSLKSQLSATRIAIVVLLKVKAGVTLQNALLMMIQNLLLISKCYSHFDAIELENKFLAHTKTAHKEQLSLKGHLDKYAGYKLRNGIVTHGSLCGFGLELQNLSVRSMCSTALLLQNCLVSRIANAATGLCAYFELLDLADTREKYIVEISIGLGSDGQNALLTELKDAANEDRYSRSLLFRLKALIASLRYEFLPLDIHDELRAALFNIDSRQS